MPDIGSMVAAVNGLATAGRIAMGLIDLKTVSEVQAKAVELNRIILGAQSDLFAANATQTALADQVRELESQIASMKDWEAQKQRYKLAVPYTGCLVYALLKSMSNDEPPHYICTNCYENGKRSILQIGGAGGGRRVYFQCPDPSCKAQAYTSYTGIGGYQYAEELKTQ